MEIFMRNVPPKLGSYELTHIFARVFHSEDFSHLAPQGSLINFEVYLPPHTRSAVGYLNVPTKAIGELFLLLYGDSVRLPPGLEDSYIEFELSRRFPQGKPSVTRRLESTPYCDPAEQEASRVRKEQLESDCARVSTLQFLYLCADRAYSVEWEKRFNPNLYESCSVVFQDQRRQVSIICEKEAPGSVGGVGLADEVDPSFHISMTHSQINNVYLDRGQHAVLFNLSMPPRYEREWDIGDRRERMPFLPLSDHERVAPYASLAIRITCDTLEDFDVFRAQCSIAQLSSLSTKDYALVYRNLFSSKLLSELDLWLRSLDWIVAFQVMALVRNLVIDPEEALSIKPIVDEWVLKESSQYVATVLQKLQDTLRTPFEVAATPEVDENDLATKCETALREHRDQSTLGLEKAPDPNLCYVHHVIVTPTTVQLEAPLSNGPTGFLDEGEYKYRYDREVECEAFIKERVGRHLYGGLELCGRKFEFLAYSLSALKEHCVWYVCPFKDEKHGHVNASRIIEKIGTFDNLPFDPKLRYCPARYAARLSQAFTATDVSVSVKPSQVSFQADISTPDNKYHFTDGVGTLSTNLAEDICMALKESKRKAAPRSAKPAAFQIRFMGSKGMLSIDHTLKGHAVVLRKSMVKFDAPDSREIEIARAFDKPGTYYLNRPLIMLLDGLGVPFETFKKYQDITIMQTRRAAWSLNNAAGIMEQHGLGTSFRLSSVLFNLERIHISLLPGDKFYTRVVQCVVNHVLRQLKYNARIPIPGGWTLPGVADVHKFLKPKEIFACVKAHKRGAIYLQGPVLISRSPTIHPGDVMIVNAIGAPPPNSPFAIQPLRNTVVFSVLGDRPVPSCLGGGDLDGDVYNLIPLSDLPEFMPKYQFKPASYQAAEKKYIDHPSTQTDIADFVMDYMNSDVLGMIANKWLIIADQTQNSTGAADPRRATGIFSEECLALAQLHSDAVDFQKTGRPVPVSLIPKTEFLSPDWSQPETMSMRRGRYYQSRTVLGNLYREISLPMDPEPRPRTPPRSREGLKRKRGDEEETDDEEETRVATRKRPAPRKADSTDELIAKMDQDDGDSGDEVKSVDDEPIEGDAGQSPIQVAVRNKVREYISLRDPPSADELRLIEQLYAYHRAEMRSICVSHTLSHRVGSVLTEEEIVAGTISQATSQQRKRKEEMSKVKDKSAILVRKIRATLAGGDEVSSRAFLRRAYIGWRFSEYDKKGEEFGAWSFWVVCLLAIFDAVKELDDKEGQEESQWH